MNTRTETRTNEINSDSSERKCVHLSDGLMQSSEISYTFRVWIRSVCGFILYTCLLCGGGLHWITFRHKGCVITPEIGSNVVQFVKRDKGYSAQSHCLTYMHVYWDASCMKVPPSTWLPDDLIVVNQHFHKIFWPFEQIFHRLSPISHCRLKLLVPSLNYYKLSELETVDRSG